MTKPSTGSLGDPSSGVGAVGFHDSIYTAGESLAGSVVLEPPVEVEGDTDRGRAAQSRRPQRTVRETAETSLGESARGIAEWSSRGQGLDGHGELHSSSSAGDTRSAH